MFQPRQTTGAMLQPKAKVKTMLQPRGRTHEGTQLTNEVELRPDFKAGCESKLPKHPAQDKSLKTERLLNGNVNTVKAGRYLSQSIVAGRGGRRVLGLGRNPRVF